MEDLRSQAFKDAKGSYEIQGRCSLLLGRTLSDIYEEKRYKEWLNGKGEPFRPFKEWSREDLRQWISVTTAYDMVEAFRYLRERHPDILKESEIRTAIRPYYDIVLLLRCRKRIEEKDCKAFDRELFSGKLSRMDLQDRLQELAPCKMRGAGKENLEKRIRGQEFEVNSLKKEVASLNGVIGFLESRLAFFEGTDLSQLRRKLEVWLRPDRGGEGEAMAEMNDLFDELIEMQVSVAA